MVAQSGAKMADAPGQSSTNFSFSLVCSNCGAYFRIRLEDREHPLCSILFFIWKWRSVDENFVDLRVKLAAARRCQNTLFFDKVSFHLDGGVQRWRSVRSVTGNCSANTPPCDLPPPFASVAGPIHNCFLILILSLQMQKKRRIVARVQCRSIKSECPEPTCDEPVHLPGRCCKTCPGDSYSEYFFGALFLRPLHVQAIEMRRKTTFLHKLSFSRYIDFESVYCKTQGHRDWNEWRPTTQIEEKRTFQWRRRRIFATSRL